MKEIMMTTRKGSDKKNLTMALKSGDIRINNMDVGNLKKYLDNFPDDAKVVIAGQGAKFEDLDCQIACNFDHQRSENVVQFTVGLPPSFYEGK